MIAPSGALRYGGGVCCRTYIGLGVSQAASASPAAPKITKRTAVILSPAIDSGILTSSRLLHHLVAQLAAQDFADIALWQLGAEFDEFRPLVAREFPGAEGFQRFACECGVAFHDKQHHRFARPCIGHPNGGAFGDAGMA